MTKPLKIAISTGGGDAPGLNAVIRATTLSALDRGWEVWGIRHGYRGLIDGGDDGLMALDRARVRGIAHLGGTILGTANRGDPFHFPVPSHDGTLVPTDRSEQLVRRFRELGFDALVAIGGDGSLRIAHRLLELGLPRVIGVPKTIDNDVAGTDVTFGFDTAVSIATEAIDRLHTTAEAHERVMVVELMGRHAGWIALHAGLAGGADAVLIPEIPFDPKVVAKKVMQRVRRGRNFSIVVAAEGAAPLGGQLEIRSRGDEFRGVAILGGIAERMAEEIAVLTGRETRSLVLGHLQRGGSPTSADRLLSMRFGAAATRAIAESARSGMVAVRGNEMDLVDLSIAASGTRTVPLGSDVVMAAREMGICFGDEETGEFMSLIPPPSSIRPGSLV